MQGCIQSPFEVAQILLSFNASGLVLKEQHGVGYLQTLEGRPPLVALPSVTVIRNDFMAIQLSKERVVLNIKNPSNPFLL